MSEFSDQHDIEHARIVLELLESVERDNAQSHRRLASELGIALGLTHMYLKRCINKGLVKVRKTPARRYAYFLTPKGLTEKSRLTGGYLSYSFTLFRRARLECTRLLEDAAAQGWWRVTLAGHSDLAEIAMICATECNVKIVAMVDAFAKRDSFFGSPVYSAFSDVPADIDAVLITELSRPRPVYEAAAARFSDERIFLPDLLNVTRGKPLMNK
jgi:predicted transcriptional regulator